MPKKNNSRCICDNGGETTMNWMGKDPSGNSWNTLKPFTEPQANNNIKNIRDRNSEGKALQTSIQKIKDLRKYIMPKKNNNIFI